MKRQLLIILMISVFVFTLNIQSFPYNKSAAKMAKMEESLEKILGTNTSWKAAVFKDLRLGMTCNEVKKHFKGLKCNTRKKYDFPKVSGKLLGKVKEYQFTFKNGRLQNATIVFGARAFDPNRFEIALLNVAQRKWGKLSPDRLQKKIKVWTNSDYDSVTLSFVNNNWHLKNSMPKRDTGEVKAGSMTTDQIRVSLAKLLGPGKYWKAAVMTKLNRGNTCAQVKQVYKVMKGCDPQKKWSFGHVLIKGHDLIHALKFGFSKGELQNVTLIFHRQLPKEGFKKVSLNLFEKKWGRIKLEKRNQDLLTIYKRNFGVAQRYFVVDHWEIKHDFPKLKN
ncbi:MAG: hypothetical protein KAT17_01225 [Candidatus Aminicenantes bacterium]|nr:hypothetical protein [Candidatus Aminicenantes bacterium]